MIRRSEKSKTVFPRAAIAECIDQYGWRLCGVFGDKDHFPFIYSIGNHECGLPKLLEIGSNDACVMNEICEKMRMQGRRFRNGELIDIGAKYPLKVLNANSDARQYAWQVGVYYETDDYSVQQIVTPDGSGRYPGDSKCAEPYCLVPILTGSRNLRHNELPDFGRIAMN